MSPGIPDTETLVIAEWLSLSPLLHHRERAAQLSAGQMVWNPSSPKPEVTSWEYNGRFFEKTIAPLLKLLNLLNDN